MKTEFFIVNKPDYHLHGKVFEGERVTLEITKTMWSDRPITGGGGGTILIDHFIVRRSDDPKLALHRDKWNRIEISTMSDGLPAVFAIPVSDTTPIRD